MPIHCTMPITPTIRPSHQWFQRILVYCGQNSQSMTATTMVRA